MEEAAILDPHSEDYTPPPAPSTAGIMGGKLTDSAIQAAMREVGLSKISVSKWRAQRTLGQALEEIGAIHVCAGEYVISNHLRLEAIQLCRKRLKSPHLPVEEFTALMKTLNDLIIAKDVANTNLLKAVQGGMIKDDPKLAATPPMPPKGVQILVQQNNGPVTPTGSPV